MASVDDCIRAYVHVHLRAEGRSPATLEWHGHVLGRFAAWLKEREHPADPVAWTPLLIKAYMVSLNEAKTKHGTSYSPHSLRSMHSSLRSFCKWLHVEEMTPFDVMARVCQPKTPKEHKPNLSPEEVTRVLAAARGGERNCIRDEAVILFLLDTGARASEVVNLRASDLEWQTQTALVRGKGAKDRRVPFGAHTAKAMQRYTLKVRGEDCPNFFQSEEGQPLTRWGLSQLCRRVGARSGLALNVHIFRHTHAITYLRAGGSVFALQKTLGHSSLDMSLKYSHMLTDDLVREHQEHGPVAFVLQQGHPRRGR